MMMKSGDRTDTGILRKDDDGRYWAASSAAVASLGKEGMTDEARMAAIQAAVQKSAANNTGTMGRVSDAADSQRTAHASSSPRSSLPLQTWTTC